MSQKVYLSKLANFCKIEGKISNQTLKNYYSLLATSITTRMVSYFKLFQVSFGQFCSVSFSFVQFRSVSASFGQFRPVLINKPKLKIGQKRQKLLKPIENNLERVFMTKKQNNFFFETFFFQFVQNA